MAYNGQTLEIHLVFAFPGPDVLRFVTEVHWWIRFPRRWHYGEMQTNHCFQRPSCWFWIETEGHCSNTNRKFMCLQGQRSRQGEQKGCHYNLLDAPLSQGRGCQKGVNKLKTCQLLLLPLGSPHKNGQQLLVSRFSKGWLKQLEGAQHESSPTGTQRAPGSSRRACQLGAVHHFHTRLQNL